MRTLLFLFGLAAMPLVAGSGIAYTAAPPPEERNIGDRQVDEALASGANGAYTPTKWASLIPKGWDPAKALGNLNFDTMSDGDPRAMAALYKLRKAWESAPVEPSLNGARVRVAGFVVPLESRGREVVEFLLVPNFGGCIHVPPPPANQIIHVIPANPIRGLRAMSMVWVSGALETVRAEARTGADLGMGLATAGYRMKAETVEAYKLR